MPGLFIDVEVEDAVARDAELAAKLTEVCPVDIFAQNDDGTLRIVAENLDECVLCELCINATPPGAGKGIKVYSGQTPPAQAVSVPHAPVLASAPDPPASGRRSSGPAGSRSGGWRTASCRQAGRERT